MYKYISRYTWLHLVYFISKGLNNLWSATDCIHAVAFTCNTLYPHHFFMVFVFYMYIVHSSTVYRGKYFNKKVPIKKNWLFSLFEKHYKQKPWQQYLRKKTTSNKNLTMGLYIVIVRIVNSEWLFGLNGKKLILKQNYKISIERL